MLLLTLLSLQEQDLPLVPRSPSQIPDQHPSLRPTSSFQTFNPEVQKPNPGARLQTTVYFLISVQISILVKTNILRSRGDGPDPARPLGPKPPPRAQNSLQGLEPASWAVTYIGSQTFEPDPRSTSQGPGPRTHYQVLYWCSDFHISLDNHSKFQRCCP